jgi:uncharacterized protein (TIGR00251 family)
MAAATRITLRVSPNAKRSAIVGPYGDGWKVRVAAAPEDGKANAELGRLLAEVLSIAIREVRIVGGASSQNKIVELAGVSPQEARDALTRASARL